MNKIPCGQFNFCPSLSLMGFAAKLFKRLKSDQEWIEEDIDSPYAHWLLCKNLGATLKE